MCLRYGVGKPMLEGFTDSDMSRDVVCDDLCRGSSVVAITTVEVCGLVDHRNRIHGSGRGRQRADLDDKFSQRARDEANGVLASL